MNFLGGFSVQQPEEFQVNGYWIPETPQRPQFPPRSNPILENWTNTTSNYNGLAQIFEPHPQVKRVSDQIPGPDWNNMPLTELLLQAESGFVAPQSRERPLISSLQPQMNNVREEFVSADFDSGSSWIGFNGGHQSFGSELMGNGGVNGSSQMFLYDSPAPSKPYYDLNVSPAINAAYLANDTNYLQFTPVTPDLGYNFLNQHAESRSISGESTSRGREMPRNSVQCADEAIPQNCDQLAQSVVDFSSTLVSNPVHENKNSDKRSKLVGIDLNETPQQKPPKRRKHRPKVVREGKPKRSKKPSGSKNSETIENRPAKRKYVRKKLPQAPREHVIDLTEETSDINAASAPKTCKRVLNFDLEEVGDKSKSDMAVQLETDNRVKSSPEIIVNHQSTESLIAEKSGGCASLSQNPDGNVSLALMEEMQTKYFHQAGRLETDMNANQQQRQCAEGMGQDGLRVKANFANPGRVNPEDLHKVTNLMRSAFQSVPKTPSIPSEQRGSKRDHSQTAQQNFLSPSDGTASLSNGKVYKANKLHSNSHTPRTGRKNKKKEIGDSYGQTQNMPSVVSVPEAGQQNLKQSYNTVLNSQFVNSGLGERSLQGMMITTSAFNPLQYSTEQGSGQMFQTTYTNTQEKIQSVEKVQEHTPKKRGPKKKNSHLTPIDEITYRLQTLHLNGSKSAKSKNTKQNQNQNALVLYKGAGTLVPYQGDKKRKPRPKVDLDSETNRIWNLLMGKEGSESVLESDEKKEKWWAEERNVFRGRVDSFIARMHLVQGDRRFSRWKGSVVDSVIGVFLTQNVSDHLSSSAFMSMASRFPPNPSTQDETENYIIDAEVPIAMINPDIRWYEVPSEPIINKNFTEAPNQSSEEELILSQDSFDSSITQVTGGIRSSSGSNSETEGPSLGFKSRNGQVSPLTDYLQTEKSTLVQEVCSQANGHTISSGKSLYEPIMQSRPNFGTTRHLGGSSSTTRDSAEYPYMQNVGPFRNNMLNSPRIPELWLRESFTEESTSSWQSLPSTCSRSGKEAISNGNSYNEQIRPWWSLEAPMTSCSAFSSIDFSTQQDIPVTIPHVPSSQSSCISHHQEGNNLLPTKNATKPNFNKLTEMVAGAGDFNSAINLQTHRENKLVEANSKEKTLTPGHLSKVAKTKTSKPRKGKAEDEKKNAVDWDELRRKVKSNGMKTERSKDAMDSLDYEAVRSATVSDISETIKERGMNNMLAERIKDFLDRVVRDHGSIDLEWLRDVPPDKAKDYLLSIRGLGLKSVECVRLLTLHHLAFPVDTNVGRIAVRLGWVPLQPLPESLQLHLLELYPVLESIQKYLWPRLCKLDQRTLYELHYQMITFGKVFCTKSKPNCNACPMRGECRHFASAFASARLALPGPGERSIVSTTVPQTEDNNNNPGVVIHPLQLPAPEQSTTEIGFSKIIRCEPIIEEPATPEPEFAEVTLSDIEDFEDPNEIPTIKLDHNEFRENLQSYMQNNMELQEADMSKALVALNPDIASIPVPKLKYVSRLRTEHQVYELPDSHPLLERLDRREPDDPSPYLLAIWAPGETADSIHPPKKSCGSPDKFCSDVTCFSCSSVRESTSQTVRGTILIPCRTAMRGSFPLNGTYFQVNEMFADHASSHNPINVPRQWIWNLPRRTVYFGTSVSTIFRGLTTQGIQYCFWKGFVCVRGFDQAERAPRPLNSRLHFPASKIIKIKDSDKK